MLLIFVILSKCYLKHVLSPSTTLCSYCSTYCIFLGRHATISPAHTQCSLTEYVCVCGVTECLNYGLIVSLAGFCCWHHIGPVKVNYWNMFICCQPLLQAVTCMETQTNTLTLFTKTTSQSTLCPSSPQHFP